LIKIVAGSKVRIRDIKKPESGELRLPMSVNIPVLYEDNHLLVVEKPFNMLSQGDLTGDRDLLSLLKQSLKEKYKKPGSVYLGLVHRLDRPAGGVMVFAKTSKAAARLSAQIKDRSLVRCYLAVVRGLLPEARATLQHYLVKDRKTNRVTVVDEQNKQAKAAKLTYQVLANTSNLTLVHVQLHTGRAHQVRVQFAACGRPLYGDQRYGKAVNRPGEQLALWAHTITLHHPTLKKKMTFYSHPPRVLPWTLFDLDFSPPLCYDD
jgi:23S rRNA pseudouridine1911/1915/1917 synthase